MGGGKPGDFESIQGVECEAAKKKIIDKSQLLRFIVTVLFSLSFLRRLLLHVLLYVENHVLNDDAFIALGEGYEGKYLARGDEVLNELLDDRKAKCFPSRPFVHTRQL